MPYYFVKRQQLNFFFKRKVFVWLPIINRLSPILYVMYQPTRRKETDNKYCIYFIQLTPRSTYIIGVSLIYYIFLYNFRWELLFSLWYYENYLKYFTLDTKYQEIRYIGWQTEIKLREKSLPVTSFYGRRFVWSAHTLYLLGHCSRQNMMLTMHQKEERKKNKNIYKYSSIMIWPVGIFSCYWFIIFFFCLRFTSKIVSTMS